MLERKRFQHFQFEDPRSRQRTKRKYIFSLELTGFWHHREAITLHVYPFAFREVFFISKSVNNFVSHR